MEIYEKLIRARELMKKEEMECLILSPSADLEYMTGFAGISFERPIVFVLTEDNAFFVIPEFEISGLSEDIKNSTMCVGWGENENPYEKIALKIRQHERKIKSAAVGNSMSAEMFFALQKVFDSWEWSLGERIMIPLRSRKTHQEYEYLRMAQYLSAEAFTEISKEGMEGKTELEVSIALRKSLEKRGLICNGNPLVAAGKNSALPHHMADETVIKAGDVVILDFGGCYRGYYSDITRTVVIKYAPEGFEKLYEIVRDANEQTLLRARAGMEAQDLDLVARNIIEKAGYGQYFTHRLGHGIGREVHEHPYISNGNKRILEVGNVFSDEPGIYIPDRFGMRLEDVLFLNECGAECLTPLSHDFMVVD